MLYEVITRKGVEKAKKNMVAVPLKEGTIPFTVIGRYGAGRVLLKPREVAPGLFNRTLFHLRRAFPRNNFV